MWKLIRLRAVNSSINPFKILNRKIASADDRLVASGKNFYFSVVGVTITNVQWTGEFTSKEPEKEVPDPLKLVTLSGYTELPDDRGIVKVREYKGRVKSN